MIDTYLICVLGAAFAGFMLGKIVGHIQGCNETTKAYREARECKSEQSK